MQKIFDWVAKIPRKKEWWLEKLVQAVTGCGTGCLTIFACYVASVTVCVVLSLRVAQNFNEALTMGLAWGSTLGLLTLMVFGSAALSVIAWFRGA